MSFCRRDAFGLLIISVASLLALIAYVQVSIDEKGLALVKERGRSLYMEVYGPDDYTTISSMYKFRNCETSDFSTSTEFFNELQNSGLVHYNVSYLSNLQPLSLNSQHFPVISSNGNIWNLVCDQNLIQNERVPIYITRNVKLSQLDETWRIDTDKSPYLNKERGVIVCFSGAAYVTRKKSLSEWSSVGYSNKVISP